ncbi:nuclear transport factor 2 family protein [Halioglobus maricola]|uniref:Nuclear transport factor 2 family protein n=1 Tax=Halioglobus maricola TaxID=2601894 RepID=A0A5P9NP64_9GAMM|nr:nuclear transport factor 2 family protein [Halioglobus maricola]QFU77459.1 nuclear transport factor 2 family protein [Halioglobus maricola]
MNNTLVIWHEMLAAQDPSRLAEVIADDCDFVSPVLHTTQEGGELTKMYLTGAFHILGVGGSFRYIKEVVSGNHAVLEFVTEVDGLTVNGVDIMTFDDEGKICEFKVMVRPLKALHLVKQKMADMLEQLSA